MQETADEEQALALAVRCHRWKRLMNVWQDSHFHAGLFEEEAFPFFIRDGKYQIRAFTIEKLHVPIARDRIAQSAIARYLHLTLKPDPMQIDGIVNDGRIHGIS